MKGYAPGERPPMDPTLNKVFILNDQFKKHCTKNQVFH